MPVSYNRISLTDSIGYSEILDPKLKTNTLRIQFFHPLEKESAAKSALAFSLLTTSNAVYPSMEELAKKLDTLYASRSHLALPSSVTFRRAALRFAPLLTAMPCIKNRFCRK